MFDRVVIGAGAEGDVAIDTISGATITVMVENATLMRSVRRVAESRGLSPPPPPAPAAVEATTASAKEKPAADNVAAPVSAPGKSAPPAAVTHAKALSSVSQAAAEKKYNRFHSGRTHLERRLAQKHLPDRGAGDRPDISDAGAGVSGLAGETPASAGVCARWLFDIHRRFYRLVFARAAFRHQRAHLRAGGDAQFPVGRFSHRSDDVHSLVVRGGDAAAVGARYVLRLAVPVRRLAGTDAATGAPPRREAIRVLRDGARTAMGAEVHHSAGAVRRFAAIAGAGRAPGRDRTVQDRHHHALSARMGLRACLPPD